MLIAFLLPSRCLHPNSPSCSHLYWQLYENFCDDLSLLLASWHTMFIFCLMYWFLNIFCIICPHIYCLQFSYTNISNIFSFLSPVWSHSLKFHPSLDFARWVFGWTRCCVSSHAANPQSATSSWFSSKSELSLIISCAFLCSLLSKQLHKGLGPETRLVLKSERTPYLSSSWNHIWYCC